MRASAVAGAKLMVEIQCMDRRSGGSAPSRARSALTTCYSTGPSSASRSGATARSSRSGLRVLVRVADAARRELLIEFPFPRSPERCSALPAAATLIPFRGREGDGTAGAGGGVGSRVPRAGLSLRRARTGRLNASTSGRFSRPLVAVVRSGRRFEEIGFQQAVEVDHHELHLGVVDGALRGPAPRLFGGGVVGKDADDLDRLLRRSRGSAGP